jgi:hypothetical protein
LDCEFPEVKTETNDALPVGFFTFSNWNSVVSEFQSLSITAYTQKYFLPLISAICLSSVNNKLEIKLSPKETK